MKRRDFLRIAGITATGVSGLPLTTLASDLATQKLTILHTNDVHSRIEAFDDGRNKGLGGAAKRATLIQKLRKENKHVLLLDSGDIFQGTPYFNFYGGELEIKLMSEMNYDLATMGNHDFDAGIDGFEKQLKHANFPFVVSNYNFDNTILNGKVKDYHIINKGKLKIGLFGLGIELNGLVPKDLYKETEYLNPITVGNRIAGQLKHDEKCDFVICLSHLGYKYNSNKISDVVLAEQSKDIDLILGGHTHTFLSEPTEIENAEGKKILINQVGFAGINLGKIDVYFTKSNNQRFFKSEVLPVQ